MGQIEKRVEKLEDQLGVNEKAETLDEMIEKCKNEGYGPFNMMTFVVEARSEDKKGTLNEFLDGLYNRFPKPLADLFKDEFTRPRSIKKDGEAYRLRREGESKADYLKYQLKECRLVVGFCN